MTDLAMQLEKELTRRAIRDLGEARNDHGHAGREERTRQIQHALTLHLGAFRTLARTEDDDSGPGKRLPDDLVGPQRIRSVLAFRLRLDDETGLQGKPKIRHAMPREVHDPVSSGAVQ